MKFFWTIFATVIAAQMAIVGCRVALATTVTPLAAQHGKQDHLAHLRSLMTNEEARGGQCEIVPPNGPLNCTYPNGT